MFETLPSLITPQSRSRQRVNCSKDVEYDEGGVVDRDAHSRAH